MSAPALAVDHDAILRGIEVETIRRLCQLLEDETVTEWADRYRILPETSTAPGPYRSSVVPYARRPQDLMVDPEVRMVVLCWAIQLGKSTVIENALGYRIRRMPSPMVLVRPKIEDAEGWMRERFVPMVLATPTLRERITLERSTDPARSSANLRYKPFGGGFLFAASATSHAELVSRSAPFVAIDEADSMEMLPQGNPIKIVLGRQGAADIALAAVTSTPRLLESSQIWPLLEGGTFERYYVPCPHCQHRQHLVWGGPNEPRGIKWPENNPERAFYLCESCGCQIDESAKSGMLASEDWRPTKPDAPYYSFHLNGLYSPFPMSSWGTIAKEFVNAQGKSKDLQVVVNERFAEPWDERSTEAVDPELLGDERCEVWEEGTVPVGVGCLTMWTDVQGGAAARLEWGIWGWGAGLESWLVARGVIVGDPEVDPSTPGCVWEELDAIRTATYPHVHGRALPVHIAGVDSGFAKTAVYRFTRRRHRQRVFPTKGVGGHGVPLAGKLSPQTQERVLLLPIGVDQAKDEFLRSQFYTRTHGPGFVHLPEWMTPDQRAMLVLSEVRRRHFVKGNPVYTWQRRTSGAPNEDLDIRVGCRAMLELLGTKFIDRLGAMAAAWALPPDSAPVAAAAPRGRRVISRGID